MLLSVSFILGLLIIIVNYIAALLTLSSKDPSYLLFTMQSDDMVICSLNVRGLSNNTKRRETFLWLKKKSFLFTFCKKRETEPYCITFIARKYCAFTLQENSFFELYLINCLDYERRYAVKTGSFRKFNAKWGAFIRRNDP